MGKIVVPNGGKFEGESLRIVFCDPLRRQVKPDAYNFDVEIRLNRCAGEERVVEQKSRLLITSEAEIISAKTVEVELVFSSEINASRYDFVGR